MHFVGELFLCDIVTANIVHTCVQSLLDGASGASPDPAKAESAGVLLTVAGRKLNEPPSRARLDQYMARVRAMIKDGGLPNPVRYGLMDVVDLQQANWVPKKVSEGPATIAEIHQAAARDQSAPRPMSMAPGTKAGAAPQRAGDLSRFGNLARSKQVGVGMAPSNPFGAFAGRMSRPRGASAPATPTAPSRVASSNAFDLLADSSDKPDREPASVAMPAPVDRAALARRVRAMIDEYLQLEAAAELVACFGALEQAGRPAAVGEIANIIVDCRLDRVEKIAAAARHLRVGSVLPEDAVVAGLAEFAAQLEDIVLDAPHALSRFGLLAAAAGVSPSRVAKVLRGLTGSGASVAAVTCAYLERLVADNGRDKTKADIARVGPGVDRLIGQADAVDATTKALGVHDLLDIFSA
ncbi:hypothetical protein H4R19_006513 [Coemansia spiralis]|nr:hypothetical protein H4R19_006513 [Coemansia spiralis]